MLGILKDAKMFARQPIKSARLLRGLPAVLRGLGYSDSWATGPSEGSDLPNDRGGKSLNSPNPLRSYFEAHHQGKGVWKWLHYFDVYNRHFSKFVGREINVVEVGVFSGGSLEMWREYFGP